MSRWIESFESHPFNTAFSNLKEVIITIDEKEISDTPLLEEFIRLQEVITYIDKYLTLVNPKISPSLQQQMNNINNSISNVINEINSFKHNKNPGHLTNANNNIDSILSQLYIFNTKLPKFTHQSIYAMLSNYENTLKKSLDNIDLPTVISNSKQIENLKNHLIDGDENTLSIKYQIDEMLKDIKYITSELRDYYNKTLNDTGFDDTIKEQINNAKNTVLQEADETHEKYIQFSNKIEKLDKFYLKIFDTNDGLEKELDERLTALNELQDKYKEEFHSVKNSLTSFQKEQKEIFQNSLNVNLDTLKEYEKQQQENNKNLYEQIESLLPHATSTGLAKAFEVERKKFSGPIKNWNRVFIISLSVMFVATFFTFLNIDYAAKIISFTEVKNIETAFNNLVYKLPLYGPLIWLCIYASSRRSENQRLEQEYAHKEALAKSYSSYKQQIEHLDSKDNELLIKLIDSAISTISTNASNTLDKKHGDKTPLGSIVPPLTKSK